MALKPTAEFAIKHATAPENLIKWVSDGNYLNWEVKNAFCVPRDNALVFATQAQLDAFIRWLRTGDRDENVKELAAALREAYARKNGDHRKHAADWCSGIDLDTRCMEDEPGPEDARFGKHDDQADALRNWRDVFNPPKHIDDTPARVETVYYNPPGNPTPTFEGTIPMSTTSLSFTTVNYVSINGGAPVDLSKLPADNIFSLIEQTEAEIKRLNEISNKPKALVKRIDDLQAGIDRLVAEIDGRDA